MKTTLQILLIVSTTSVVSGQPIEYEPNFVKSRNLEIHFEDTVIHTSILTLPIGRFSFAYGKDILTQENYWIRFHGKGRNTQVTKDTLIKSQKPELVIDSYFPMLYQDSAKVLIASGYPMTWTPHHFYECEYTYLLNQSGLEPLYKSEKDSTIRITLHEFRSKQSIYDIITIDLSGEEFLFHQRKVKHTYSEEFEVIEEMKGRVKKAKAIQSFFEQFNKYDFSDTTYTVKHYGSEYALIELKTSKSYSAILRPQIKNDRGEADEKALKLVLHELWVWTRHNNRKEEKRKNK